MEEMVTQFDNRALALLLPIFPKRLPGLNLSNGRIRFNSETGDCPSTLAGLAGSGIACPRIDAEILSRYMQYYVSRGFLEAPVGR